MSENWVLVKTLGKFHKEYNYVVYQNRLASFETLQGKLLGQEPSQSGSANFWAKTSPHLADLTLEKFFHDYGKIFQRETQNWRFAIRQENRF